MPSQCYIMLNAHAHECLADDHSGYYSIMHIPFKTLFRFSQAAAVGPNL